MTKLRFSAPDWCFLKPQDDPASYYTKLAQAGYAGVEMVDPSRWNLALSAGLSIETMSGPGMTDGLNNQANHAKLVPELIKCLETAAANGIAQVIFFSGNRKGMDDAKGLKNCIAAARILAPHAERLRVTLAFEMLNSIDHADYQADAAAFGFSLVRSVNSPCVKALYDVYHMFRMGAPVHDELMENLDIISHIHIAGAPKRDFPGKRQEIDYAPLVADAHAHGYAGFWGMEFLPGSDPINELGDALRLFESCIR